METSLEKILVSAYKEEMILYLKSNPNDFDEAVKLALSDKQPYSWRAAWLLWSCIKPNDLRINKHIKKIIGALSKKEDGHQRELLKILFLADLNEVHEGYIFDTCMNIWEQVNKRPSVRHTAFRFIVKIGKKHPELKDEILHLTKNHFMDTLSPGVKRSVYKLAEELNK